MLKVGLWKEADQETLAVMLKAVGREKERLLNIKSIENFPCKDLRTIDQLWVKYSEGRFGFSVQKRIWESVGKDYGKFGCSVGWCIQKGMFRMLNSWPYNQLTFNTTAPHGHLPAAAVAVMAADLDLAPMFGSSLRVLRLFSRVQTCKL